MADPPAQPNPISPISILLQSLGMTRQDLMQHTEQMRAHLSQSNPSLDETPTLKSRNAKLSRALSFNKANPSRANSSTPPMTPVKAEPTETAIPVRQMDTMEIVMARKSKQEKYRRRDSISHSRESRRVSTTQAVTPSRRATPPLPQDTPHHYKYYSERVIDEASSQQSQDTCPSATALPKTPSRSASDYINTSDSRRSVPKTPIPRHVYSQYPSSSRASTPASSPPRVVNLVSSPGPMRSFSDVEDDEKDNLPYKLPPGPYSTEKPDYSYAAIIGQAVLSSPEHRLTLQDIYEWITTVYPYYTRGEQTWMNSIRHSLSTMAVFRKVTRGRNEGKSLWAIWDCDIPCFEGGGFRKSLCADMAKPKAAKSGPKRKIDEIVAAEPAKKRKKPVKEEVDGVFTIIPTTMLTAPMLPPFYAPLYPNPQGQHPLAHHQPYYQPYIPAPLPAEVIFPPLPPTSAFHRAVTLSQAAQASKATLVQASSSGTHSKDPPSGSGSESSSSAKPTSSSSSSSSSSSISVPDLTPNCSSSSSPPPESELSQSNTDAEASGSELPSLPSVIDFDEDEADKLTAQWLASPSALDTLESTFGSSTKGNGIATTPLDSTIKKRSKIFTDGSPTMSRRTFSGTKSQEKNNRRSPSPLPLVFPITRPPLRPSTPPPRPCTPPRKTSSSVKRTQLNAQLTPLSHRGLHMSPSPSLAHYKNNLDPPPPASILSKAPLLSGISFDELALYNTENSHTPSRKHPQQLAGSFSAPGSGSGRRHPPNGLVAPVTPKRSGHNQDSPPFGTPSQALMNPHDPGTLLDEELRRLGSQESPEGFFGGGGKLYTSPELPDPARWERYW